MPPSAKEDSSVSSIQIPKYNHGVKGAKKLNAFRHYVSKLEVYLGAKIAGFGPDLLNDINHEDPRCGLGDVMDRVTHVKTWIQAQYHLMHALNESFCESEFSVTSAYTRGVSSAPAKDFYDRLALDPDDERRKWYPFATMCFHELRALYDTSAGTEAVVKTMELNAQISAFGSQNNEAQFSKWLSKMWESFNIVEEIIRTHDPSYLAALQLLQEIKAHGNSEWSGYATQFTTTHPGSFTMKQLLDGLRVHSGHVHLKEHGAVNAARAHLARTGERKECAVCAEPGCNTVCKKWFHTYCPTHHIARAASVPDEVAREVHDKQNKNNKRNFAQRKKKQQNNGRAPRPAAARAAAAHAQPPRIEELEEEEPEQEPEDEVEIEDDDDEEELSPPIVAAVAAGTKRQAKAPPVASPVKKRKVMPVKKKATARVSSAIAAHQHVDNIAQRTNGLNGPDLLVLSPPRVNNASRANGKLNLYY